MIHKKLIGPTVVTALSMFALVFVLVQLWVTQFREVMRGIVVLAIYGTLTISLFLCIALIFIGLSALYRVLWERINGQNYKQVEV